MVKRASNPRREVRSADQSLPADLYLPPLYLNRTHSDPPLLLLPLAFYSRSAHSHTHALPLTRNYLLYHIY